MKGHFNLFFLVTDLAVRSLAAIMRQADAPRWLTFSRNDQRQRMVCRASPLMEEIPAPLPANQGREQWQLVILSSLRREQWHGE
jgi:hypothetical protein